MKTLTKFVILCFICLILYTLVDQIIFLRTGMEPSTLTERYFTVIGVEFGAAALIQIGKLIRGKIDEHSDSDDSFDSMQLDDDTDCRSLEENAGRDESDIQ